MQFGTTPLAIQELSRVVQNSSTSTHNRLRMDEKQCRRLSSSVELRIARNPLNVRLQD